MNLSVSPRSCSCVLLLASLLLLACDRDVRKEVEDMKSTIAEIRQEVHNLDSTLAELRWDFTFYKISNQKGSIDFASSNLQEIGDGFHVGNLSLAQHLTGVKVKGRIINGTSLDHSNVAFHLTIGSQTKEFTINSIPPNTGAYFDVYVPDVPIDRTRWGRIEYQRSSITYYMK